MSLSVSSGPEADLQHPCSASPIRHALLDFTKHPWQQNRLAGDGTGARRNGSARACSRCRPCRHSKHLFCTSIHSSLSTELTRQGEIARTLTFSFALFRPLLGLAMHTLLCLAITSPNGSTPAVPPQHLSTVIRSTWEVIAEARPFDQTPPVTAPVRGTSRDSRATGLSSAVTDAPPLIGGEGEMQSLLKDIVMDGTTARAQELLGAEPGPELWKRLLG